MGCASRQVEEIISSLSVINEEPPPHTTAREINLNGSAFQSIENGGAICVTEKITRITITCNGDLCEDGYDPDGDIGTFLDAFVDE